MLDGNRKGEVTDFNDKGCGKMFALGLLGVVGFAGLMGFAGWAALQWL